jgi:hypothetical protein
MPDASGKLTNEEKARITKWINDKWIGNNQLCPICGNSNWVLGDHLVQPVTIGDHNSLMLGGAGYPQVMLISPTCGYTMFLNAVIIGITAPDQEQASAAAE